MLFYISVLANLYGCMYVCMLKRTIIVVVTNSSK